ITNDLKIMCEIILEWKIWNSESKLLKQGAFDSKILPCYSKLVGTIDLSDKEELKKNLHNTVIFYNLKNKQSNEKDLNYGFRFFDTPKKFNIKNPGLSFEFVNVSKDFEEVKLIIKTRKIAFYVFIDSYLFDFIASDNFFSMEPNESRVISIRKIRIKDLENNFTKENILNNIEVKSLFDLINNLS
ncbi:MAG: glycoside hydrolase family 2 protein, partial [Candidatus Thorarchaeota archaeon]